MKITCKKWKVYWSSYILKIVYIVYIKPKKEKLQYINISYL